MNKFNDSAKKTKELEPLIKKILTIVGEDTNRDGLLETPKRVARTYQELLQGYAHDPKDIFKVFDNEGCDGVVIVKNIQFYSMCEHHMVPFFGKIHVGYIPNGKILGLSKFGRLVDIFAHRLQVQEKLTKQIADSIEENLQPLGVIVVSEAEHLCMSMRGVKKPNSLTKVISKKGLFSENRDLVDDFFRDFS